ncbi:bacteriohemerythrin [Desulfuromonas acetoxidans]|uniref:Hemerythrin-like, metal-binding n=1 Tax=Desulfuromonas acetoxidans (strain DSM 684 / 11070) TaxID=281689 RepID=Q1K1N9_DESA6|nr:bacteriohemerythrin [Desulfuromonas acetoxidans]EAT16349.1 Hemerythrin-like, metal-binding [Desulfuromonas acetoxidans DSM 684]MBF0645974.1 hemerythrin family protein [Desulfuromonas acetoxidans]NVD23488.1 hemerythrin family protein [Desulfuromonas acetoxidans]NVE16126.1 hemerythrin family protein [Desulfuromonas acetoxidans]
MAFIEWNQNFAVNVDQFDDHHRHLIDLLNKTHDQITRRLEKEKLGLVLVELIEYAKYHFRAEEVWMKNLDYPKLKQHCAEHHYFINRVQEMCEDYNSGNTALAQELLSFMKNWLSSHILGTDREYSRFIEAKP